MAHQILDASQVQLTKGCIDLLHSPTTDKEVLFSQSYIIQVLSLKSMNKESNSSNPPRWRIIFSDSEGFVQAMLATQLNEFVLNESIKKNSILKVDKFSSNSIQGKSVLIIMGVTVLGQCNDKIGNPQQLAGTTPVVPAVPQAATVPHQPQPQPQPVAGSSVARNPRQNSGPRKNTTLFPIEALSPYQNNWTIKARVIQKSAIREYATARGEGRFFNVTLMDETGEIRGTAWNSVVDDLFAKFEEGKAYYISKARVNLAKKKFSNLSNEYELGLERTTEVEECTETDVPAIKYNFVPFSSLGDIPKDSIIDVIGIVKDASPISSITTKQSKTLAKRELTLVDESTFSVRLTLWAKHAEDFKENDQPVIAFKGVKLGDFQGRSLSMVGTSIMTLDPNIPEAFPLKGWFDNVGSAQSFQQQSGSGGGAGFNSDFHRGELKSIQEVKALNLIDDKPQYFSIRATVMHIRSEPTLMYPGCPTCSKKIIQSGSTWRCDKCDMSFDTPEYRYIISMAVGDWSGQAWLQGFGDVGATLFEMTANQFQSLREENAEQVPNLLSKGMAKVFNFNCRAKTDTYNDTTRTRYGIVKMFPMNYKEECQALIEALNSPWGKS